MIKLRDLQFSYPAPSSDGDAGFSMKLGSLDIARTDRVAFVGSSGCGKTTLAHLIAGIQTPESGEIHVGGFALHRMSDRARRNFRISEVGFIFQEFELLDYLSIEENILLPYMINRTLTLNKGARDRARALAVDLGIGGKLDRHPGQLSGGEKQRVAIARALSTTPSVIIADEPTGNLDAKNSAAVTDLITSIADEHGAALIMVTHDTALLDRFDRCIDIGEEVSR